MAKSPIEELFEGTKDEDVGMSVKCLPDEREATNIFCQSRKLDRNLFIMASIKEGVAKYVECELLAAEARHAAAATGEGE